MAKLVELDVNRRLDDYTAVGPLAAAAEELRADADRLVPALRGRTIWMINSTASGGGVAELLPPQIALLRELGLDVRWLVIETDEPDFFPLTKRIHNMLHGEAGPPLGPRERELYDAVSAANARALGGHVGAGDVLIVHDPQPLGAGALLRTSAGVCAIWRCHIGLEVPHPSAAAAWEFLRPYLAACEHAVFSAPEYVPDFLAGRASVIPPTIDPLSHKNRDLSLHKLVGVLCDAALAPSHWPLLAPPFADVAQRLRPDGSFVPVATADDIGLLARPIVAQVSRWDRLKGFAPLMDGFSALRQRRPTGRVRDERHRRRLENVRLVLAGPEAGSITDDPEALAVLDDLRGRYAALPPLVQQDVAILALPMRSRKENALMVNALQRCADIVVQNSLREGFGLTVAEAMWKRTPILGSARAFGVRQQVRDGVDGRLAPDPEDADAIARLLHDMLADSDRLEEWGRNAQHRVHGEFLIFTELRRWIALLARVASGGVA